MPALPQELLDIIVGYIPSSDLNTLKSCSLSSRSLATPARPLIFHTIHLLPPPAGDTPVRTQCQKFYKLLQTTPRICAWVKALRIVEGSQRHIERGLREDAIAGTQLWVAKSSRTLSLILPLLNNTRQLSIQGNPVLTCDALTRSLKSALKEMAPRLEVLHLRGFHVRVFSQLDELFEIAAAAKELKGFSLVCEAPWRHMPASLPSGWRPRLQSLAFSVPEATGALTQSFIRTVDLSHLRILSLKGLERPELKLLFSAFTPVNVVESLNIWTLPAFSSVLQPYEAIGLATFPHLRSLRISGYFDLPTFQEILEECAHNASLETVVFESPHHFKLWQAEMSEEKAQWERMLTTVRASAVDRVEVWVSNTVSPHFSRDYRERVEDVLGQLAARDVLTVRDVFPSTSLAGFEGAHPDL